MRSPVALAVSLAILLGGCSSDSLETIQTSFQQGRNLLAQEQYQQAEAAFLEVIRLDPGNVEAIFLRGQALQALERWPDAYAHYARAADISPQILQYSLAALKLEYLAGRWKAAEDRLVGLENNGLDKQQLDFWKARIASGQGNNEAARRLILPLAESPYAGADVLAEAANIELRLGNPDGRAKPFLTRALERNPQHRDAQMLLAQLELAAEDESTAHQRLKDLFEANPDDDKAGSMLGAMELRQGNIEAATAIHKGLAERNPDSESALMTYGELLAQTRALADLDALVARIEPSSRRLEGVRSYLAGLALMAHQKPDEASDALEKASLLLSDQANVWFARGEAELQADTPAKAALAYNKVLEIQPDHIGAALQLARIDLIKFNIGAAKNRLKSLATRHPDLPQVDILLAQAELLQNRPEQAIHRIDQRLTKLPAKDASRGALLDLKASALDAKGEKEAALELYLTLIRHATPGQETGDQQSGDRSQNIRYRVEAARLLDQLERQDEAEAMLKDAAANSNALALAALGELVMHRSDQAKDIEEAQTLLNKALEIEPKLFQAQLQLGLLYLQQQQLDKATEHFNAALAISPQDPLVNQNLGIISQTRGDLDSAEAFYRTALNADENLLLSHTGLAEIMLVRGQPSEALQAARSALRLDPTSARALLAKAAAHSAMDKPLLAQSTLESLVEHQADNVEAWVQLGRVRLITGDPAGAQQAFEQTLALDPKHGTALVGLVDASLLNQQPDAALALIETRLQEEADNAFLLRLKGTVLLRVDRFADAITTLVRANQLDPNNTATLLMLARAQSLNGDADAAIGTITSADSDAVSTIPLTLLHAQLLDGKGDLAGAIDLYRSIVEQVPDYAPALNNLAWGLYRQGGQEQTALGYARRAYLLNTDSISAAHTLAMIQLQSGRAADAYTLLKRVNEVAKDNPELQLHLSQAAAKSGHEQEAQTLITHLLSLGDDWDGMGEAKEVQRLLDAR